MQDNPKEPHQELLNLKVYERADFSTYVEGENSAVVESLKKASFSHEKEFFYVSGPHGSGKSHLMGALRNNLKKPDRECFLLDLEFALKANAQPEILNLELPAVTILDNVDVIAGDQLWELAVFDLFNRWYDQHPGTLIVTASCSFNMIGYERGDLHTRLGSGVIYSIEPLDDDSCVQALMHKAKARGFSLQEAAARYLVNHFQRDMHSLVRMLDKLDVVSYEERHRITVPFIKKVLEPKD
ncbi:MAG: DnaA regulatory inactivator Hda [Succinivibrio sp.]|nr:DnaA regulatory inactivator Hda [Succinivibrio sp.]